MDWVRKGKIKGKNENLKILFIDIERNFQKVFFTKKSRKSELKSFLIFFSIRSQTTEIYLNLENTRKSTHSSLKSSIMSKNIS